jgi:hypothetical protein
VKRRTADYRYATPARLFRSYGLAGYDPKDLQELSWNGGSALSGIAARELGERNVHVEGG